MKTRYYLKIPRQARERIQPCIPCIRNVSDYMRPNKIKVKIQFLLNEFGGECKFDTSKILTRLIIELLNYRLFVYETYFLAIHLVYLLSIINVFEY